MIKNIQISHTDGSSPVKEDPETLENSDSDLQPFEKDETVLIEVIKDQLCTPSADVLEYIMKKILY